MNWFVVYTLPGKETVARQHLEEQGYNVYLPMFKKIRRHARRVDEVLQPLFPRYLFVSLNLEIDAWRAVNGTRGVSYLLLNDGRPLGISTSIIKELQVQEDENGLVPVACLENFTKGKKLRIVDGTFKDQVAVFQMMDDKKRVQLLLNFLGRDTKISLPVYAVEAA
jgi:transcriptional antiterminator RfaH